MEPQLTPHRAGNIHHTAHAPLRRKYHGFQRSGLGTPMCLPAQHRTQAAFTTRPHDAARARQRTCRAHFGEVFLPALGLPLDFGRLGKNLLPLLGGRVLPGTHATIRRFRRLRLAVLALDLGARGAQHLQLQLLCRQRRRQRDGWQLRPHRFSACSVHAGTVAAQAAKQQGAQTAARITCKNSGV